MRKITSFILAVAVAAVAPLGAAEVDEVIARHVAARGGDAWQSVESVKLTGTYTAFSETSDFTVLAAQGDRYRIENVQMGQPFVMAYDGRVAWQKSVLSGGVQQPITGLDRRVFLQDVDYVNPFFGYEEKGYQVELVGAADLDGQEVIQIDLTRPDGSKESWYLDPETHLEVAKDDTGSDLGGVELPRRTFFDDFRDVGGVKIPFYTETEWYTRHRIQEVENAVLNPETGESGFRMPAPQGMEELQALAGTWDVALETRAQPSVPWSESRATSTITPFVNGSILQEHMIDDGAAETYRTVSYDRFRETYRVTQVHTTTLYQDVQEGTMEEGRLSVSNVETQTTFSIFGMNLNQRTSIFDITGDGFKVEQEMSMDGGENWILNAKYAYTRKE